ncbi:predicted protein [Nematostella vectensis]|uniref:DUF2428 domain-containing protein n=1 Tax=Nematostella vectensis TaxID=45351 RepID=A7SVK5_NEMVE|nr:predicted protein [Nematostella vectensis]|eukprot:XP_001624365.1 predicted protein [Nematostella vectensis]
MPSACSKLYLLLSSVAKRVIVRAKRVIVRAERVIVRAKRVIVRAKRVILRAKGVIVRAKRVILRAKRVILRAKRVILREKRFILRAKRVIVRAKRVIVRAKRVIVRAKRVIVRAKRVIVRAKRVIVRAKRVIAGSSLLSSVAERVAVMDESHADPSSHSLALISPDDMTLIADTLMKICTQCRHWGILLSCKASLLQVCRLLTNSTMPSIQTLPRTWLDHVIAAIATDKAGSSVTRRSFTLICAVTSLFIIIFISSQENAYTATVEPSVFGGMLSQNLTPVATTETPGNHKVTVFLRLTSNEEHKRRLFCYFMRTFVLYWPTYLPGKTVLVFDQESEQDHNFGFEMVNMTTNRFPHHKFEVKYEPLPNKSALEFSGSPKPPGYNRQLWSSFFIDKYTDDDIIAWMDNDAAYAIPVTASSIFNGDKLRAMGSECSMSISWVQTWATTTELALGVPMIADFMTYFPVYIYRDTFTNCRNHILKRFKTNDFVEAFRGFYKGYISPVCIILSYAWHFERDRYDWSFKMCSNLAEYNKKLSKDSQIPPENAKVFLPQPQTAFHYRDYVDFLMSNIRISYCLAKESEAQSIVKCPARNVSMDRSLILFHHDLQRVESPFDTPCAGEHRAACLKILQEYFQDVKRELEQGVRTLEWQSVETVDEIAKQNGIQCSALL